MLNLSLRLGLGKGSGTVAAPEMVLVNKDPGTLTITDLGDGESSLAGTGSANSSTAMAGDFILRFQPQQVNNLTYIGVADDPNTDNVHTGIDHGLYFRSDFGGTVQYFEDGVAIQGNPSFTAGQNWFLKRTGTTLSMGYGGTDGVTGYTEFHSVAGVVGTFYFDHWTQTSGTIKVKRIA